MEENQKRKGNNNEGDSSDDDGKGGKKKRVNVDDEANIFICNICHHDDPSKPKLKKSEVRLDLSEKEKEVLQFRYNYKISVVCLTHHEKDVRFWFNRNTKQCRNIFGKHRRTSGNKTLTSKEINLPQKNSPSVKICPLDQKLWRCIFPCQLMCKVTLQFDWT